VLKAGLSTTLSLGHRYMSECPPFPPPDHSPITLVVSKYDRGVRWVTWSKGGLYGERKGGERERERESERERERGGRGEDRGEFL
jgi:hypothetical protein